MVEVRNGNIGRCRSVRRFGAELPVHRDDASEIRVQLHSASSRQSAANFARYKPMMRQEHLPGNSSRQRTAKTKKRLGLTFGQVQAETQGSSGKDKLLDEGRHSLQRQSGLERHTP